MLLYALAHYPAVCCRAIGELAEVDDTALLDEMLAKVQLPPYVSNPQ